MRQTNCWLKLKWDRLLKKIILFTVAFISLFLVGFLIGQTKQPDLQTVRRSQIAMGTIVEIQVRGLETEPANIAITAAFQEIYRNVLLLDEIKFEKKELKKQDTTEIDRLLTACDNYWHLSSGALDCALGSLINVWGFHTDQPSVPSSKDLELALAKSGWGAIEQQADGSWIINQDVSFDFGAIAKGAIVDQAINTLQQHGVNNGLVNAGGDIRVLGDDWIAGIQHPRIQNSIIEQVNLSDMAVATSGDYEQFFIQDGVRYHHILDPHHGFPVYGIQSVTVLAPTCLEADALATIVFVLGKQHGIELIEELPSIEVLIIDDQGVKIPSSGFLAFTQE